MSTAKHTPGPWKWKLDNNTVLDWWHRSFQITCGNRTLAAVNLFAGNPENSHKNDVREGECNAALIAAAPDLLAACEIAEATIERLQRHAPGSAKGTLDVIRASLAKAKGEA